MRGSKRWTPLQEGRFHRRNIGNRQLMEWARICYLHAEEEEFLQLAARIAQGIELSKREDGITTGDIVIGGIYRGRDGTTRRVLKMFGRGRNRQVSYRGKRLFPERARISDFAHWAVEQVNAFTYRAAKAAEAVAHG